MSTAKKVEVPKIDIVFPLTGHSSWNKTRQRLAALIAQQEKIDQALRTAMNDPARPRPRLSKIESENLVNVYNAVVADGRYIEKFLADPGGIAKKLKMSLPPASIEALHAAKNTKGISDLIGSQGAEPAFLGIVAIAIVIVFIVVQIPNEVRGKLCGSITVSKGRNRYSPVLCFDASKVRKL